MLQTTYLCVLDEEYSKMLPNYVDFSCKLFIQLQKNYQSSKLLSFFFFFLYFPNRKTGIFFLLKYHCPIEVKGQQQDADLKPPNKLTVQDILKQQNAGTDNPVTYYRRPPQSTKQDSCNKR